MSHHPSIHALKRALMPGVAVAACLLLGACASRSGYLHRVQPSLAPPTQPSPTGNRDMYLGLIRQMQQKGAYYASLAHIDAFCQHYGNPPELRELQAEALRETGQPTRAEAVYRSLLDTDQAAAAWHGLGLIDAAQGRHAEADKALARAVQMKPIEADYLGDLGFARLQAGQLAAAREPLAKAAELAPDNAKAIANLAVWMLLNNEYTQADALMQRAALPSTTRNAVRNLAMQLRTPQATGAAPSASGASNPPARQPDRIAGIPGSMLERFVPSSTTHEAQP